MYLSLPNNDGTSLKLLINRNLLRYSSDSLAISSCIKFVLL